MHEKLCYLLLVLLGGDAGNSASLPLLLPLHSAANPTVPCCGKLQTALMKRIQTIHFLEFWFFFSVGEPSSISTEQYVMNRTRKKFSLYFYFIYKQWCLCLFLQYVRKIISGTFPKKLKYENAGEGTCAMETFLNRLIYFFTVR